MWSVSADRAGTGSGVCAHTNSFVLAVFFSDGPLGYFIWPQLWKLPCPYFHAPPPNDAVSPVFHSWYCPNGKSSDPFLQFLTQQAAKKERNITCMFEHTGEHFSPMKDPHVQM